MQSNHWVLKNGEHFQHVVRKKNDQSQSEPFHWKDIKRDAALQVLNVEERSRAKEYGQPLETGKSQEMDSALELSERNQPSWHLEFSPEKRVQTSNLQNGKITKLYYFKLLSFLSFVTAAREN